MNLSEEIKELQEHIDGADPFLVDHILTKTTAEILDQIHKLEREKGLIEKTQNRSWAERHNESLDTLKRIYRLRCIKEETDDRSIVIG